MLFYSGDTSSLPDFPRILFAMDSEAKELQMRANKSWPPEVWASNLDCLQEMICNPLGTQMPHFSVRQRQS